MVGTNTATTPIKYRLFCGITTNCGVFPSTPNQSKFLEAYRADCLRLRAKKRQPWRVVISCRESCLTSLTRLLSIVLLTAVHFRGLRSRPQRGLTTSQVLLRKRSENWLSR